MNVRPRGLLLLALVLLLAACNPVNEFNRRAEPPAQLIEPEKGQRLVRGQPFRVHAEIEVEYPVASIEVKLWDVATNEEHTWTLDRRAAAGEELVIDETFDVPETLPPGENYRLQVTAHPVDLMNGAAGYSQYVEVVGVER